MCKQPGCNWWKHLLRMCHHHEKVVDLQMKIVDTRTKTNKQLKKFNRELNLLIKDENVRLTLTNIKKVAERDTRHN